MAASCEAGGAECGAETVYSVEDPDDAGDNQIRLGEAEQNSCEEREPVRTKDSLEVEQDNAAGDSLFRGSSETTEYDLSTDDESLRSEPSGSDTRCTLHTVILCIF